MWRHFSKLTKRKRKIIHVTWFTRLLLVRVSCCNSFKKKKRAFFCELEFTGCTKDKHPSSYTAFESMTSPRPQWKQALNSLLAFSRAAESWEIFWRMRFTGWEIFGQMRFTCLGFLVTTSVALESDEWLVALLRLSLAWKKKSASLQYRKNAAS
jgi:hypothetical protein